MIFVDSNIPMYLVGAEHSHKRESLILLEQLVSQKEKLVTNVEVIQEILHRYTSIHKKEAIQPTIDELYGYIDEVFPITEEEVLAAKDILISYQKISARDALHAAQMKHLNIRKILSFDRGFDQIAWIERIPRVAA